MCKAEYAKDIDAIFPGIQGGPLMHVMAGKAVCFGEALRPIQGYAAADRRQCQGAGRDAWPAACGWSAAAPTIT